MNLAQGIISESEYRNILILLKTLSLSVLELI